MKKNEDIIQTIDAVNEEDTKSSKKEERRKKRLEKLNVSDFKNNCLAKKSKVFFYSLIDYFCVLILSFIFLIGVANPIMTTCSGYQDAANLVAETTTDLYEIVASTRLMRVDEDDESLEDISVLTNEYITTLVKTTLYVYDEPYRYYNEDTGEYDQIVPPIEETFLYIYDEESDEYYPNDSLLYYYLVFKPNHEDVSSYVYDGVDRSTSSLDDYFYRSILTFNSDETSDYFITNTEYHTLDEDIQNSLSRWNILDERVANNLMQYLVYEDTSSSSVTDAYDDIGTCYQNATQFFIDEVEEYYTPYIEELDVYSLYYSRFSLYNIYAMIASYVVSFIILFNILPIFLKQHRTLGQRILKLGFCRLDEMEPTKGNLALYYISTFIWFFSSQLFCEWFISNLGVISYNLYGSSFSMFQLIIFTLLVLILSYIFLAFNKNHQTISLLLSNMVIKKTDEFEKTESLENLKDDELKVLEEQQNYHHLNEVEYKSTTLEIENKENDESSNEEDNNKEDVENNEEVIEDTTKEEDASAQEEDNQESNE